jgi:hypothetical protein
MGLIKKYKLKEETHPENGYEIHHWSSAEAQNGHAKPGILSRFRRRPRSCTMTPKSRTTTRAQKPWRTSKLPMAPQPSPEVSAKMEIADLISGREETEGARMSSSPLGKNVAGVFKSNCMGSFSLEKHDPTAVNEMTGKKELYGVVEELQKFMLLLLLHPEMARPGMRIVPGASRARWEFSRLPGLDVEGVLDAKSDCDCCCLKFVLQEMLCAVGNAIGGLETGDLMQDLDSRPSPPSDVEGVPGGMLY